MGSIASGSEYEYENVYLYHSGARADAVEACQMTRRVLLHRFEYLFAYSHISGEQLTSVTAVTQLAENSLGGLSTLAKFLRQGFGSVAITPPRETW